MKRNFAVILILLLAFPALSTAEDSIRVDGNLWKDMPDDARSTFIAGFYEGMEVGGIFSMWSISDSCKEEVNKSFRTHNAPYCNTPYGQIRDGISTFYSDYRNRKILFRNAIKVVIFSIGGAPQADLDKITEYFRGKDSQ